MKWGMFCKKSGRCFFCKKKWKMGVLFCKKVENVECFFVKKSGKWGCFFVKKWNFPQCRVHYVQYQYFFILHFTYLGGAYAPNAPPAYGPGSWHLQMRCNNATIKNSTNWITNPRRRGTCPPAAQAVTSAKRPPSLMSRLAAVVTRRTPVAPNGWPIDREPPHVLIFSSGNMPNYTQTSFFYRRTS